MSDEEKKIIIDEDWKSQVEAEKEAAKSASEPTSDEAAAAAGEGQMPPMPPASYMMHISMLASEAMMSMGQMPHPATGETGVHPEQAKYLIDTIAMLCEKTKGNVSAEETQGVEQLLHQLRMAYVAIPKAPDDGASS